MHVKHIYIYIQYKTNYFSLRKKFVFIGASYLSHNVHLLASAQACENTLYYREYWVQASSCFIYMWRMWAHWNAPPGDVIVILMSSAFIYVQWRLLQWSSNLLYRIYSCSRWASALPEADSTNCVQSRLIHPPAELGWCWLRATWLGGTLLKRLWVVMMRGSTCCPHPQSAAQSADKKSHRSDSGHIWIWAANAMMHKTTPFRIRDVVMLQPFWYKYVYDFSI